MEFKKEKVVAVSGYFNPLHSGHIKLFEEAKKLGDKLMVIVNNDYQVKLKGSVPFMDERERSFITQNIKCVDYSVVSIDEDKTVCETLKRYKPHIFANGGDRFLDNVPEKLVCDSLGIKMAFNVGGTKTQSSSNIIKSSLENSIREHRPWGWFETIRKMENVHIKILHVEPNQSLSLQKHAYRNELWQVVEGIATATVGNQRYVLQEKDYVYIRKDTIHRLENFCDNPLKVVEVQTGTYFGEDDIKRFSDIYSREINK